MKLFKKLAAIHSPSRKETAITQYILRWVKSCVPDTHITVDRVGNIYLKRGESETYPCLAAHLDQVQNPYPKDYTVIESPCVISGYSPSQRKYCGLGADDKCGIWVALKLLQKHPVMKVVFFVGEEIGCVGSSQADMDFFDDARFVVQADRRGAHDLITSIYCTEICSEEFVKDANPKAFRYKETEGMLTDVYTLKENGLKVSCINVSCGYYEPHTSNEYVDKNDMLNCLAFIDNIVTNCTKVYKHEMEEEFGGRYSRYGRYDDYARYEDFLNGYKKYGGTFKKSGQNYTFNSKTGAWAEAEEVEVDDSDFMTSYHSSMDDYDGWGEPKRRDADLYDEQIDEAISYAELQLAEKPETTVDELYYDSCSYFTELDYNDFVEIYRVVTEITEEEDRQEAVYKLTNTSHEENH